MTNLGKHSLVWYLDLSVTEELISAALERSRQPGDLAARRPKTLLDLGTGFNPGPKGLYPIYLHPQGTSIQGLMAEIC